MHATLVTRANGVWASVHAFVGDGENSMPRDPYVRVVEIIDLSPVGFEVLFYLASVVLLSCLGVTHLIREERRAIESTGSTTLMQSNRPLALGMLAYFAAVGLWIGSSAVLFAGLASLLLLLNGDSEASHPLGGCGSPADALLQLGMDLRVVPVTSGNRSIHARVANSRRGSG